MLTTKVRTPPTHLIDLFLCPRQINPLNHDGDEDGADEQTDNPAEYRHCSTAVGLGNNVTVADGEVGNDLGG